MKILTISDSPLAPSGVGTQTNYMIQSLLKTGKYEFISIAGAIKHENYNVIKTEEWGEQWVIIPVDGYGSQEQIRSIVRNEKPDALWFMTDPRFFGWLWEIEDEIFLILIFGLGLITFFEILSQYILSLDKP